MTVDQKTLKFLTCLSTDTKPTTGLPETVLGLETDTGLLYRWNGTAWAAIGGGGQNNVATVIVYKEGSNYVVKGVALGNIISSGTNAESAIATAISTAGNYGSVIIRDGTYTISSAHTGWNLLYQQHIIMGHGTKIDLPTGFANSVFNFTPATNNTTVEGGLIQELTTPSRLWTGYNFSVGPADTDGISNNKIIDARVYGANKAVRLATDTDGWINGSLFMGVTIHSSVIGYSCEHTGTYTDAKSGFNNNTFLGGIIQRDTITTHGVKDLNGRRNSFYNVYAADFAGAQITMNITANSKWTRISGGSLTSLNFADLTPVGFESMIDDAYQPRTLVSPIIKFKDQAKTGNYTLTSSDHVIRVDATSSAFTLTLPTAIGATGKTYVITRADLLSSTNLITLATTSSQTIGGATNEYLTPGESITVESDNANWRILSRSSPASGYYYMKNSTNNRRYIAGCAYPASNIGTTSTTVPAIDTLFALPFIVGKTTKFDTITFRQTTAATAGGVARCGIYRDNGNMYPGALIFDTGSIATDGANGGKDTTITSGLQVFPTGTYWLAIEFGVAAPQLKVFNTASAMITFGMDSGLSSDSQAYGYSVAHSFGALPDPYTAGATLLTTAPAVGVPIPRIGLRPI